MECGIWGDHDGYRTAHYRISLSLPILHKVLEANIRVPSLSIWA